MDLNRRLSGPEPTDDDHLLVKRLRTENRLLRQRIENLEKESASLADKLIQDQVTRAQEAEETFILKNQLASGKQLLLETQRKLQEAEKLIAEIKERTESINVATVLDDKIAQHLVQQLQEELISVRLKDNETAAVIKDMKVKIKELEDTNQMLQRAPSNDVQHLQEELIAVKLREAEANLSLKELRMKVNELDQFWEKHCMNNFSPNVSEVKNCKHEVRILQEELMTVRIREAQSLSALKEMKQKVMELETQLISRFDVPHHTTLAVGMECGTLHEPKLWLHIALHYIYSIMCVLQYADSCVPVAHSEEDLQTILALVVGAYNSIELSVYTTKTSDLAMERHWQIISDDKLINSS
uniref:Uncharacterized protein n=1 Tax=Octopus bimaculoides TaxID=37653 RepID=A0A0L8HPV6_OCTBM